MLLRDIFHFEIFLSGIIFCKFRDLFSQPSVSKYININISISTNHVRSRHILDIVLNIFQFKIFMSVLISQSAHKSAGIHINVSFNGPYLRSASERGEGLFICFETESYRLQNALLIPPPPPPLQSLALIIVTSPSPYI